MAEHVHREARSTPSNLKTAGAWLAFAAVLAVTVLVLVGGAWAMSQFATPK